MPEDSYVFKKSESTIYLLDDDGKEDGCRIICKACYVPNNIESMTLDGFWADEAGQFKDEIQIKLMQRVAVRKGFGVYTTSLYSGNFIYNDVLLPWEEMNEEERAKSDMFVVTMSSLDNPSFPIDEYYKAQQTLPPEVFERDYNSTLLKTTGIIYPVHSESVVDMEKLNPHFATLPFKWFDIIIAGVDFAVSSPCAVSVVGIRNGTYYVIDEFKRAGVEVVMGKRSSGITLSKVLKNFMATYHIRYFYADPEDKEAIRSLREERLPIYKADKAVYDGISKVRTLLVSGQLLIDGSCVQTIQEMRQYAFQLDSHGFSTDKPVKRNDHLMDALRYAIYTHTYIAPKSDLFEDTDVQNITPAQWQEIANSMRIPANLKDKNKLPYKKQYGEFNDPFYHS